MRCEAYRCLTRILLRREENPKEWVSSFLWIFERAQEDSDPSVPVAFLNYLINPEVMDPFLPISEFYLKTTRIQKPILPTFESGSTDGFLLAEQIWNLLGTRSRYNPQLRKLLFILYKQLFGVGVPQVYGQQTSKFGIKVLSFNGTQLELYPAMVRLISYFEIDKYYLYR